MFDDSIILRNEPAEYVASSLSTTVLDSLKGSELYEWHRFQIENLYVSHNDKIEIQMDGDRGWDTKMSFAVDSNPEESVDRLTDYTYNRIKQTVRSICSEDFDVDFAENEKVDAVRVRQTVESTPWEPEYTVEFDTTHFDSVVISDNKMSGQPRIAGRRILVQWIWSKYARRDMDYEEIVDDLDNTVTTDEVESAIEYAKDSDDFDSIEEMESDEDEDTEFVGPDEIKASMDSEQPELLDIEDNRGSDQAE